MVHRTHSMHILVTSAPNIRYGRAYNILSVSFVFPIQKGRIEDKKSVFRVCFYSLWSLDSRERKPATTTTTTKTRKKLKEKEVVIIIIQCLFLFINITSFAEQFFFLVNFVPTFSIFSLWLFPLWCVCVCSLLTLFIGSQNP